MNDLIDWQTYYRLHKHLPMDRIMTGYKQLLLEFNQTLVQMLSEASEPPGMTAPSVQSGNAAPGAGAGGHAAFAADPLSVSGTVPNSNLSSSYTATIDATGGWPIPPYTFTLVSGSLPSGTALTGSLVTTGIISGVLTTIQTASFRIGVLDSNGGNATGSFTVLVAAYVCPTITLTDNGSVTNGVSGSAYRAAITASGGHIPYTYTKSAGTLPSGSALFAATGLITSSALTATGSFSFTITATDLYSCSGSAIFGMTSSVT